MQHEKVTPQLWMLLSKEVRDYLTKQFNVPRSGVTEVRDQTLITDGRTMSDLEVITREAMCEFIGSDETFGRAFEITIAKVHSELHPPVGIIESKEQTEQRNTAILSIEPIEQVPEVEVTIDVPVDPIIEEEVVVMEPVGTETPKKKSYYVPVAERKAKQNAKETKASN